MAALTAHTATRKKRLCADRTRSGCSATHTIVTTHPTINVAMANASAVSATVFCFMVGISSGSSPFAGVTKDVVYKTS
jgi:hypothetical protein